MNKLATSIEQSRKLVALGVDPQTADCIYKNWDMLTDKNDNIKFAGYTLLTVDIMPQLANFHEGDVEYLKLVYKHFGHNIDHITEYEDAAKEHKISTTNFNKNDIPAWSLSALLNVAMTLIGRQDLELRCNWNGKTWFAIEMAEQSAGCYDAENPIDAVFDLVVEHLKD